MSPRRAGNDLTCANCGQRLCRKRGGRRVRFCSGACRQSAYRARKWASRYEAPDPLQNVGKNDARSMGWAGHFADRAAPICGPMRVVYRELIAGLSWCPIVSPDGVRTEAARLGNGAGR
jgi:hypothetical protein